MLGYRGTGYFGLRLSEQMAFRCHCTSMYSISSCPQTKLEVVCSGFTRLMMLLFNPLPTSPVAATGLCKDAADRANKQRVKVAGPNFL